MRRLGYARVSSREQSVNSNALTQQIERLKLAGAEEVFTDVESGYKGKRREALEKVMLLVKSGQVAEVIVTRLDRLSRKGKQAFALFDDFLQAKVVLRCLDEPIDLSTAAGKMAAGMLAVLAQHQSDQKSEAVKHGWQHLRNREVAMQPPFGYCKVGDRFSLDHTLFLCTLDEKLEQSKADIALFIIETFFKFPTLRSCLRCFNERYGIQTFAHHHKSGGLYARGLFRFSVTGLSHWLTNPVLQGHTCYKRVNNGKWQSQDKWDIRYNTHSDQALLSNQQIKEIEDILKHNRDRRGYGCTGQKYPLSGLVFCAECRSACYSLKANRGKTPGYNYYFQCKNWQVRSCSQKKLIRMSVVEAAIIEKLTAAASKIADLALEAEQQPEPKEIYSLKKQLDGLSELGINPALEQAKRDIQNQIIALQLKSRSSVEREGNNRDLLTWAFSDPQCWERCDTEDKIRIFKNLVNKVMIKEGEVVSISLTL